jgi:nucleoside-diphosphate-sugar epimerase
MNCRLCWTRIFYPYGIGEHPDRLCSFIIKKLINNKKVLLNSPLSTKDYIYIDDIAEALLTLVEQAFSGSR